MMSDRFFEDAETARSYQDSRPNYVGLGIEKEVMSFMDGNKRTCQSEVTVVDTLALDIGCGTGQLTKVLAPLFTKMIGIDCSQSQIEVAEEATDAENIAYMVNVAEDLSFLRDESVDFISSAAAIHYFDINTFFAEVDRVLKPGGCFLVLNFAKEIMTLKTLTSNKEVNDKCVDVIKAFVNKSAGIMGENTMKVLRTGKFPAPDYPDKHDFQITSKRQYNDIDGFVGFLISTGTLPVYNQLHPEEGDQIENSSRDYCRY